MNPHGIVSKGYAHPRKRLTKASPETYKNGDLLSGNFDSPHSGTKVIADITQLPTADGTLYISGIFDCTDKPTCLGLAMAEHLRAELVVESLVMASPHLKHHAVFHSDRGSQYTSKKVRKTCRKYRILQSM